MPFLPPNQQRQSTEGILADASVVGSVAWWLAEFINERSRRTSGPVTTGMGDRLWAGIPSRAVTSQLGQLSLASLRGRSIEYQLRLG